ncbi:MAG: hypothetical protein AAGC93_31235 [Cyanobacteria bacterium P01_F01_bin.53]
MKTPTLLNLAIALSAAATVVTGQMSPAAAQLTPGETTTEQTAAGMSEQPTIETLTNSQSPSEPRTNLLPQPTTVTIPASTGVIVSFLAPVSIDAGEGAYPMTLPLSQAIADSRGNVIAPENSPVSVVIQPEDGGARVIAQSIVIGGQIIPIQATSPIIPGTTITHMRANDRAADDGATLGRIAASGFGFFNGGDPDAFDQGAMLGNLIGMVSGRQDESTRVVQIPQGSVYVLALENAITLGR